jgi:RimJ/RimL family protein N-acetyltransferase
MNDPFMVGDRLYLRGLHRDDLEGNWYRWFNDPETTFFTSHGIFPNTIEKQTEFYERIVSSKEHLVLAIIDKATDKHIGVIGLHKINWINRNAEIAMMIGETEFQKKGYGMEAMALMVEHGFKRLNLHKIWGGQDIGHARFRKALERIGFKLEATLKEELYHDGKYHDKTIISVFAKDFFARKSK